MASGTITSWQIEGKIRNSDRLLLYFDEEITPSMIRWPCGLQLDKVKFSIKYRFLICY